jgi:hypothetical protein
MTHHEPVCHLGYPWTQLEGMLGERVQFLHLWMRGQTMAICDGSPERKWVDDDTVPGGMRLVEVGPPLCSEAHGPVVYAWDYERWERGGAVID